MGLAGREVMPQRLSATVALVFVCSLPAGVRAQAQPQPDAQTYESLVRLVNDQLQRIQALEAQLAQVQQEVTLMKGLPPVVPPLLGQPLPALLPPNPDDRLQEPFEHAYDGYPPADVDPKSPAGDLPRARTIDTYGSLRVLAATDTDGHAEVRNNSSRIGIRGEKVLFRRLNAFARWELGINLVANDRAILLINADPGTPIGQGSQAVFSRLGFVGIESPIGNFSWGKQWSPYYDVAEFADQLVIFSGLASGAFGAGTDGGLAGTGRAERAFQYREAWGPLAVGLQAQNRSLTINDRQWADAWAASLLFGRQNGFAVGAAYNEVRDGVPVPTLNEPQLGDRATIYGVRYRAARFYAGAIYAVLKQHEVDDLGLRFDGNGFEVVLRQNLTDRVWIEGAYNDLRPDSDHPGDFRLQFGAANVVYSFGDASRLFAGFKVEGSSRSDGSNLTESTFAGGLNYTF